jgi:hypothetical protein
MSGGSAYKHWHKGHDFGGMFESRQDRKRSKFIKGLKGVASYDLLDQVAREDARRRREKDKVAA